MHFLFSQYLLQVARILFHSVEVKIYSFQSAFLLTQQPRSVSFLGNEFLKAKHQSKSGDAQRFIRYLFTAPVSHVNVNTTGRKKEIWSIIVNFRLLNVGYFMHCRVIPTCLAFKIGIKGKQSSKRAFVLPRILYLIRHVYVTEGGMPKMS